MSFIRRPAHLLPGERVIAVHPTPSPSPDARWSRRLRYHDGRALGDRALDLEQAVRSSRMSTLAQVLSPGIVGGLEARIDTADARLRVEAGFGLTLWGEDVTLTRPISCAIEDIPIHGLEREGTGPWALADLEEHEINLLPPISVLVLEPVRVETLDTDTPGVSAGQPCDLDPANLAFADRQRVDGVRLWRYPLYELPAAMWREAQWRNALAYWMFAHEARLGPGEGPPWSALGVAVGLLVDDSGTWVLDRHCVARRGGRIGGRRPLIYMRRFPDANPVRATPVIATVDDGPWPEAEPAWWQARIDQFAEQITNGSPIPDGETLASRYHFLPPVGVLPPDAIPLRLPDGADPTLERNIMPATFHLDAQPMPIEALDDVVRASAGLAPFNVFIEDQMDILVPVPQAWFEEDLLLVEEVDDAFIREVAAMAILVRAGNAHIEVAQGVVNEVEITRTGEAQSTAVITHDLGSAEAELAADNPENLDPTKDDGTIIDVSAIPALMPHVTALEGGRTAIENLTAASGTWHATLSKNIRREVTSRHDPDPAAGGVDPTEARLAWAFDGPWDDDGMQAVDSLLWNTGIENLIERVEGFIAQAEEVVDFKLLQLQSNVDRYKKIFDKNVPGSRVSESEAFNALAPDPQSPTPTWLEPMASTLGFAQPELVSDPALKGFYDYNIGPRSLGAPDIEEPTANEGGDGDTTKLDGRFDPPIPFAGLDSLLKLRTVKDFRTQFGVTLGKPEAQSAAYEAIDALLELVDLLMELHVAGCDLSHIDYKHTFIESHYDQPDPPLPGTEVDTVDTPTEIDLRGATPTTTIDELKQFRIAYQVPEGRIRPYRDQAEFMRRGAEAAEQAARLIRLVRRRTARYKRMLRRLEEGLAALMPLEKRARGILRAFQNVDDEIEHDHEVAVALLADEEARVAEVNARRDSVIERVDFLVFRRPRVVGPPMQLPRQVLDPAWSADPVPRCLAGDFRPPAALDAMLDLLRDAPLGWFTGGEALLDHLGRLDALRTLLEYTDARPAERATAPVHLDGSANPLAQAISALLDNRKSLLRQGRQGRKAARGARRASWKTLQKQALEAASLGDLIDAAHGQPNATKAAAAAFGDLGEVSACLYAQLRGLDGSIRLAWTRVLSGFDRPIDLRSLAVLPRWGAVERITRRELQAHVDWLYGRVDAQKPAARALVRDLIRCAILIASHAPINRVLRGAVRNRRPLGIGEHLALMVDATLTRIGAHVQLLDDDENVIGRGIVDDLGADSATVRVIAAGASAIDPAGGVIGEPARLGGRDWSVGPAGLIAK